MSCRIHLLPLNAGGTPNGRWFLTDAPVGFDGTLSVSCDNVSFASIGSLPSNSTPLNNACADTHDIWVNIENEATGVYTFTFVSPDDATADQCADECVDCAEFVVTAEEAIPDDEVSYCENDADVYNVFTILGISSDDFDIVSVTGCTLGDPNCVAAGGNFTPNTMDPGTYTVTLEREGVENCDDCDVELTIIIDVAGEAGDAQAATVCIVL